MHLIQGDDFKQALYASQKPNTKRYDYWYEVIKVKPCSLSASRHRRVIGFIVHTGKEWNTRQHSNQIIVYSTMPRARAVAKRHGRGYVRAIYKTTQGIIKWKKLKTKSEASSRARTVLATTMKDNSAT